MEIKMLLKRLDTDLRLNLNGSYYEQLKLSKDGKYIYYSRSTRPGGKTIFIRNPQTGEETQVTPPVLVNSKWTKDTYPDWHQGE